MRKQLLMGGMMMASLLQTPVVKADVDARAIPDSEYVTVSKSGHLQLRGQRVRYWAVIGGVYQSANVAPGDTPESRAEKVRVARHGTDVLVQRYIDLGFNACRFWRSFNEPAPYTPGDGSAADSVDYFVSRMKQRGLKIWVAGLNNVGEARPEDANIVSDAATAQDWQAAVRQASTRDAQGNITKGWELRNNPARIWDARLEALAIRRMRNAATHFNHHTGLRWCDDPTFVVWELSNEEWWVRRMLGGSWQKLPPFFKNQLVARWNGFLKAKYGSDRKLQAAWKGLLPGESLQSGTVLFAPMAGISKAAVSINDANPQAQAALQGLQQQYTRADFAPQRGSDVLEFLLDLQLKHKQREAKAIKSLGKSTRLSPMVYDTGIGYEIQSQYLHQHADAVAHDAYVNGWGQIISPAEIDKAATPLMRLQKQIEAERQAPNDGPWINWLLKPPGISQGVPWLEQNKIAGKPYFCYETQIQQPAKYRADFPLRIAALASIQDWDFVCWHYFAAPNDAGTNPRPFDKPMDVTTGSHPQGYHYTFDATQNAMMRAAGLMWRQQLLNPAPRPTLFVYGRKSLYNPASMDYAGSYGQTGMQMMGTTYQYGVRIKIEPGRAEDQVIGPVVPAEARGTHNPYTPTDQIVFDWKKGFLKFDAPGAIAFTGLMARQGDRVAFKNGVTLREVRLYNPTGIYDAVRDDQRYIAFALHTRDGQPLSRTRSASLSLVSTSFNSGFQWSDVPGERASGTLPVLTTRVAATLEAPALNGMKYTLRDWHLQPLGSGVITGGTLKISADQPIFVIELER